MPVRATHRLAVLLGAVFAMLAIACGDSEGTPRVVVEGGGEVNITPRPAPTTATEGPTTSGTPGADGTGTATAEPTPTATVTASPTATPSDATPAPTPTATVPSSLDLAGSPHSTASVRSAVQGSGATFEPVDLGATCPNTSVPELTFRSGSATLALWVYPDTEARSAEWSTSSGRVAPASGNCNLPNGFLYWNANAVLAVLDPAGAGDARSLPAVEAFLDLSR